MSWAGESSTGSGIWITTDTGPKSVEYGPEGYVLVISAGEPKFAVPSGGGTGDTIIQSGTPTIAMNLIWMGW